jgi:spore maturation protein CgeB
VKRLRILYVGPAFGTCLQRAEALRDLGHDVCHLPSGIPNGSWRYRVYAVLSLACEAPDVFGANRAIVQATKKMPFDVLWIDKGLSISPRTLDRVRHIRPTTLIVSYSPDDMSNPSNQSTRYLAAIPLFDLHVTTKSYNVAELREKGAPDVLFVDNAYDPAVHRPLALSDEDLERFGAEVGFVGFFEEDRANHILALARAGIPVTVHGPGWRRLGGIHKNLLIKESFLNGMDYVKAINATRINLGFLRKANRDHQTTRSIEIPACGAFMLAERTEEHLRLFEEHKEAGYFHDSDELLAKCRYYLVHSEERRRIAAAGMRRCIESGYSNQRRLASVLAHLLTLRDRVQP